MDLILFIIFATIAVACGISLVVQKHPIGSALSLIGVMGSLAVLYLLLGAEFIAAAQLVVYSGAIMVLFVFVIMLLKRNWHDEAARHRDGLVDRHRRRGLGADAPHRVQVQRLRVVGQVQQRLPGRAAVGRAQRLPAVGVGQAVGRVDRRVAGVIAVGAAAQGPEGMRVELKVLSLTLHYRERPELARHTKPGTLALWNFLASPP